MSPETGRAGHCAMTEVDDASGLGPHDSGESEYAAYEGVAAAVVVLRITCSAAGDVCVDVCSNEVTGALGSVRGYLLE